MRVRGRQKRAVRSAKNLDGAVRRILSTVYARRPTGRRIGVPQMPPVQAFVCVDGFVSTQSPAIQKEAV